VSGFAIGVSAADGVVTLTGRVKDTTERELAERVIAGLEGVSRVENRLNVADKPAAGKKR
jgi:hyperosmotically inducible periplasmic protein